MNIYHRISQLLPAAMTLLALLAIMTQAEAQTTNPPTSKTQVVLLGTGNPLPDPDRSGPATAVVVNGSAYLVDFGPGVVRRANAAAVEKGSKPWGRRI